MKLIKSTALILGIIALIVISCKKKGCTDSAATNYSEEAKKDDGSCNFDTLLSIPTTYTFLRSGNSSVSFNGQTQRLDMLGEMTTLMKTANTAGTAVASSDLVAMYENNGYTWTDANNLGLTGSSKQLKSKTALGDAGVQSIFTSLMQDLAAFSGMTTSGVESGADGVAGIYPNDGTKGPYLMDGEGKEFTQLIEKGLMGAVFINQITMNYLGDVSGDDNTAVVSGKSYTEMEHHWDEAYGYFTSVADYPTNGTDRFWGKYANKREGILQSASKIGLAFRTGRTAIVNKNYTVRDAQIVIINNELEKVAAGTAIHYLNFTKSNISNVTTRNHSLSKALAFLEGLKYGANAINGSGMTTAEVTATVTLLDVNFNTITIADIDAIITAIASKTGLTSVAASL